MFEWLREIEARPGGSLIVFVLAALVVSIVVRAIYRDFFKGHRS